LSLVVIGCHWLSLVVIDRHWLSLIICLLMTAKPNDNLMTRSKWLNWTVLRKRLFIFQFQLN